MAELTRTAGGSSIVAALTFTLSPLHDDAHFAQAARALMMSGKFDSLYLKDPGGLVTPERAKTLIPAIKTAIAEAVLEFHSHCTIGLGPFSYLEAAQTGAAVLHTSASAAANGTGQPSMAPVVRNLRDLGLSVAVDDDAVIEMDAYFTALAAAEGLNHGAPGEFDRSYFRHQMPGGMMGTMKRQLAETNRLHLLPQVLEEVEQVRADLGYPIMVTPFSQVVGAQALMNVLSGKRYETVPDEVTRYVLGRFGAPAMPLNAEVEDLIKSSTRAKALDAEPHMESLADLRKKIGLHFSDEEFLLRAVMPGEQVDAMVAEGPAPLGYDPNGSAVTHLIRELTTRKGLGQVKIKTPDFQLELL
jgi:oxaloacetate decarboxylase (Na+ extruding) subunit alpha